MAGKALNNLFTEPLPGARIGLLLARRSWTSASSHCSERIASTAMRRFGDSRNTSLNISSDNGPL